MSDLPAFGELAAADQGLVVFTTLRRDGSAQASMVNAGVLPHPLTNEPVVGLVAIGGARKLAHLRADPRTTVTARIRFPAWLPMAALLVLVTIAIYWPATRCDFINYDDKDYVTANLHVQSGLNWESVKWAFFNPVSANWHPLTMLSHALDCQLFGLKPWGHHLTSVLLHALNTALVFLLLRRLTGAIWRSLLVAALFAVQPLHVESVAWVAERKAVLSTCFGFLALLFYARYVQEPEVSSQKSGTNRPTFSSFLRFHFYWLALFFTALGLMSKPMLVTWPFVMLLLDYWPLGRFKPRCAWPLVVEKIPFFVLVAATSIVTFVTQQRSGAVMTDGNLPLGARIGNALISYCCYLEKMVWPTKLAVFYPHPGHWPLGQVLLAGAFLCGTSMLLFIKRGRYPFLLMGWLWFVGTLVPVIGLVQVGRQSMADRYTYVPSIGVLILAIWGGFELTRRWRYQVVSLSVAGSAAIILCLGLTRQQLGYWQDSETLFRHALDVTENNHGAHESLGLGLLIVGLDDAGLIHFAQECVAQERHFLANGQHLLAVRRGQGDGDVGIAFEPGADQHGGKESGKLDIGDKLVLGNRFRADHALDRKDRQSGCQDYRFPSNEGGFHRGETARARLRLGYQGGVRNG